MYNIKFAIFCILLFTAFVLITSCSPSSKVLEERVSQLELTDEVAQAQQTSTTTTAICSACRCKVTGLNCQCSIQKQYDCLKNGGPKKPRLVFDDEVFSQASNVQLINNDSLIELPDGEALLLDLTDTSVVYEVELDSELAIERVFATSVIPLETLLKETLNTDGSKPEKYRISGNASLAMGQTIIEAGCDGLPPSGCGTFACECRGDEECNRMFCAGKCKSAICTGSGDTSSCWCSTIFFKQ
jgi:hypothetical protein